MTVMLAAERVLPEPEWCDHSVPPIFRLATGYLFDMQDEWLCPDCGAPVPEPDPLPF